MQFKLSVIDSTKYFETEQQLSLSASCAGSLLCALLAFVLPCIFHNQIFKEDNSFGVSLPGVLLLECCAMMSYAYSLQG